MAIQGWLDSPEFGKKSFSFVMVGRGIHIGHTERVIRGGGRKRDGEGVIATRQWWAALQRGLLGSKR